MTRQLTIFYGGLAHVFEDISSEKVRFHPYDMSTESLAASPCTMMIDLGKTLKIPEPFTSKTEKKRLN